jgi:hypothetical protein
MKLFTPSKWRWWTSGASGMRIRYALGRTLTRLAPGLFPEAGAAEWEGDGSHGYEDDSVILSRMTLAQRGALGFARWAGLSGY